MDISSFKIEPDTPLDIVFKRLFHALDLKNLQFMVQKKQEELGAPPFKVDAVTMSGTPEYVRQVLKELRETIFNHITIYSDSDESLDSKIDLLGNIQIGIKEKLFHWEISFPELYEGPMYFDLIDLENQVRNVTVNELYLTERHRQQIVEHHNVRLAFLTLLQRHIEIHLLKLRHKSLPLIEENRTKELELTELWMGLEALGFFSDLNKNEKSLIRKDMYKLFGVADLNYNDKHNQIKKRQIPKFGFLEKMIGLLKQEYE